MRVVLGVLCAAWLVVGITAAGQRHNFGPALVSCDGAGTVAVTIAAGPFNYQGINPTISCPEPSS